MERRAEVLALSRPVATTAATAAEELLEDVAEAAATAAEGVAPRAGAAGTAVTRMLLQLGVKNIIGVDRTGAVHTGRDDLSPAKQRYAEHTNPHGETGSVHDVMEGADMFIGLSGPGVIDVDDVRRMNRDPIVFAMANPEPEIRPEVAYPHVKVMATGRSDFPNQINNVLCFPGLFKGALACRASDINDEMKLYAARAIADTIHERADVSRVVLARMLDAAVVDGVE